jgi:hypothetical protein
MNTVETTMEPTDFQAHGPSVDFIHAVSEFLDTDPTDLLVELGYFDKTTLETAEPDLATAAA